MMNIFKELNDKLDIKMYNILYDELCTDVHVKLNNYWYFNVRLELSNELGNVIDEEIEIH